jgi:serine/threonine protein kinase
MLSNASTKAGVVKGTMWYLSPEALQGASSGYERTYSDDIWSACLVIYEMDTGLSLQQLMTAPGAIKLEELLTKTSRELLPLLASVLAVPDAASRCKSAAELLQKLDASVDPLYIWEEHDLTKNKYVAVHPAASVVLERAFSDNEPLAQLPLQPPLDLIFDIKALLSSATALGSATERKSGAKRAIRRLLKSIPAQRQTMFFSATMPFEVLRLSDDLLVDPVRVSVAPVSSTAEKIAQKAYFVDTNAKRDLLAHVLKSDDDIKSVLVFSRTKHGADRISKDLERRGIPALAIHGNKSQNARQAALTSFKKGKTRVLVATDIAARGIDIDELTHVINMDIPDVAETYVHRIGRTGRAGASGVAYSFIDREEYGNWQAVLKLINVEVPAEREHPFPSVLSTPDSFGMVAKAAAGGGGPRRPTRPQGRRR